MNRQEIQVAIDVLTSTVRSLDKKIQKAQAHTNTAYFKGQREEFLLQIVRLEEQLVTADKQN